MTLTPTETPKKTESIETGLLNALEYFVTFAIVKYVVLKGLSDSYEEISVLYNEIIELINGHESLMLLAILPH